MKIFSVSFLVMLCSLPVAGYTKDTLRFVEVITNEERTSTLKSMIRNYESTHPEVKVELINLPFRQAFEKIATMMASGNTPDIIALPSRWQHIFAHYGLLLPLQSKLDSWPHIKTVPPKILKLIRFKNQSSIYTLPYGFYLRVLFYNPKLLAAAGLDQPPATMDEFMEASRKISQLDGKYGYCLRGGRGSVHGWLMFANTMNGSSEFYTQEGKSRMDEPGSIQGIQFMIDLYRKGYAPAESINWGFKDVLRGFYTGTCAFLDQDADAMPIVKERMAPEDFAVAPIPLGPAGTAYPPIGFIGLSIFNSSKYPDESWELVAYLSSPDINRKLAKAMGVIPLHTGWESDSYYQGEKYQAWATQITQPEYFPTRTPFYLESYGYFEQTLVPRSSLAAFQGELSAKDVATQWALYFNDKYTSSESAQ